MARGRKRAKGPTPSCLPEPVEVVEPIAYDEVRRIMVDSCWRKKAYPSLGQARHDAARIVATEGGTVQAYRCPFHSLHAEKHWHVGHLPNRWHLERIAAAIRWCGSHPDEVPQPHPSVTPSE